MTKEILCLNIGQAGVQISNSCWELFCIEHGLDCSGKLRIEATGNDDQLLSNLTTFFTESIKGNYVPRSINVDLEPSVVDEIRSGPYRNLWNPTCLISGFEDASNNFGRGYISIGRTMIDRFMATLKKLIQDCDRLHGLILLHSYAGGTGSGFTNLILERIQDEYTKTTSIASVVFPSSDQSSAVVEPYNCLLAAVTSLNNIDVALLTDNQSLYELCSTKLSIEQPSYHNVNKLLSQLYSSLTVTLRFRSSLDHDINHLQTNLIPFPRLHFPISSFAPLCNQARSDHESISTSSITHQLFDDENRFISCNSSQGKYIACCLYYRGLVRPRDINDALLEIKHRKDIVFVDWSPVGFKVGISPMPPASVVNCDLAATNINSSMFYNSTAIEKVWNTIHRKFVALYRKKSFLHWFIGEGMEELEFLNCKDEIRKLQDDYREIAGESGASLEERNVNKNDSVEFVGNQNSVDDIDAAMELNTNNNIVEEETCSCCSTTQSTKSIYSIKKINNQSNRNMAFDFYERNRQLFQLFQEGSH